MTPYSMPLWIILTKWPGAVRAAVQVSAFGRADGRALAAWRRWGGRDAWSQRGEDRIEMRDDCRLAADHLAEAALESPDAAARPDVDVVNAALVERRAATDVVCEMRVPAVDEDVVRLKVRQQPLDRLVDDCCRYHHPDRARRRQLRHERVDRRGARCAVLFERRDRRGIDVVDYAGVSATHEAADHARAHPSQADHAELHRDAPVRAPLVTRAPIIVPASPRASACRITCRSFAASWGE